MLNNQNQNQNLKENYLNDLNDKITDIDSYSFSGFTIPDNIDSIDLSKYTNLTKIHNNAFSSCNLSKIIFPTSLIKIGHDCFNHSFELVEIDLSKCINLTKLSNGCFEGCNKLSKVEFPISIQEIDYDCFKECDLREIDLSKYTNLTKISDNAFSQNNIASIKLSTSLTKLTSAFDGVSEFIVPDNIVKFNNDCFDYKLFTKIVLTSNITSLKCYDCAYLEEIDLSKCVNLKEIEDYGFRKCDDLKKIDLSKCTNLTRLGKSCFDYNIKSLKLPTSLIEIDDECFQYCYKLNEIDLSGCKNLKLTHNSFPKNIKVILSSTINLI